MTLNRENAHDNDKKQYAREYLCAIANYYLKAPSLMLELLGGGTGAEYYSQNICNLSSIIALDTDKKKVLDFVKENKDRKINVFNASLDDYISNIKNVFDIINLDFCTYYYEQEMKTMFSAGQNMHSLFKRKPFRVGSLIFVTFMINGIHVAMSPYKEDILKDEYLISDSIKSIAKEYNVDIDFAATDILDSPPIFTYKPCNTGWNRMMHVGFIVKSM